MSSSSANKENEIQIQLFKVFLSRPRPRKKRQKLCIQGLLRKAQKVEELEKEFREYLGNPLTLTLNSATSAHAARLTFAEKISSAMARIKARR
jgi:dTDP-4-amino-4,6-dideoxygalactose transaminase